MPARPKPREQLPALLAGAGKRHWNRNSIDIRNVGGSWYAAIAFAGT